MLLELLDIFLGLKIDYSGPEIVKFLDDFNSVYRDQIERYDLLKLKYF